MATKKKAAKKKAEKPVAKTNGHTSEPLSEFQDLGKTGRVDPSSNGTQHGKHKASPLVNPKLIITKVKILKEEVIFGFSKIEKDATTTICPAETHKSIPHPDFRQAMQAMAVHLGLLCDYLSTQQIKDIDKYDPELVEKFVVTGISLRAKQDNEGIVLMGRKITKRDSSVTLNSPFTRFEENEETAYRYIDHLMGLKEILIDEAHQYLAGKHGEEAQRELVFPEGENGNEIDNDSEEE
jgi:hypothetical protein